MLTKRPVAAGPLPAMRRRNPAGIVGGQAVASPCCRCRFASDSAEPGATVTLRGVSERQLFVRMSWPALTATGPLKCWRVAGSRCRRRRCQRGNAGVARDGAAAAIR